MAKCADNCPFYMRFRKAAPKTFYVLVTYHPDHNCHYSGRTRLIRTRLLSKKLVPLLKHTSYEDKGIEGFLQRKVGSDVK